MKSNNTFSLSIARAISSITMRYLKWLPDKIYLSILFRVKMGKWINWNNPQTFNEKLQWLKLYNRKPEYTTMVDKYAVKDYVAGVIGSEYIIPTLGMWNTPEEIDFDALPDKFVLKTTHGGGSGGVVICRDKATFDVEAARCKLNSSLKSDIYKSYREWPYKNVRRRIIAEQLIEMPDKKDLTDFKIFCFNGIPKYIQVIQDRNSKETIDFFDTDWNHQEFYGLIPIPKPTNLPIPKPANLPIPKPANLPIPKPANLEDMLRIARQLSEGTKFVRVDLYQTCEGVYFGELTFYPASGIGTFAPEYWNNRLGDLLSLTPVRGGKYLIYNNLKNIAELGNQVWDYKFFCYNGSVESVMICFGRMTNDTQFYFFDRDWKLKRYNVRGKNAPADFTLPKPDNMDEMFDIASKLSDGLPFVRVDLYNLDGKIYFGEMTFFPASGLDINLLPETDNLFGSFIKLPNN